MNKKILLLVISILSTSFSYAFNVKSLIPTNAGVSFNPLTLTVGPVVQYKKNSVGFTGFLDVSPVATSLETRLENKLFLDDTEYLKDTSNKSSHLFAMLDFYPLGGESVRLSYGFGYACKQYFLSDSTNLKLSNLSKLAYAVSLNYRHHFDLYDKGLVLDTGIAVKYQDVGVVNFPVYTSQSPETNNSFSFMKTHSEYKLLLALQVAIMYVI